MNKSYRSIWNEALGAWVAASEITTARGKRSRSGRTATAAAVLALASLAAGAQTQIVIGTDITTSDDGAAAAGNGSVAIGNSTTSLGTNGVSIGISAGAGSLASNINQTAIGSAAGQSVSGNGNTALGTQAGITVSGNSNIAAGTRAGQQVTGDNNSAFGDASGGFVSGSQNNAVGFNAGRTVTGRDNNAFGTTAGSNVSGIANSGFGHGAGQNVTGDQNLAVGGGSLVGGYVGQSVSGSQNAAIGYAAGFRVAGSQARLLPGTKLSVGSRILTGPDSFVTVQMPDGGRSTLPSNSSVELVRFEDPNGRPGVVLQLDKGDVESQVPPARAGQSRPPWQVRTRVATVGVRGTHFRVSVASATATAVSVLQSSVVVSSRAPSALIVPETMGVVAGAGDLSGQIQDLLPAPEWTEAAAEQRQPRVLLGWDAVPGAAAYRTQLARDPGFFDIVAEKRTPATDDREYVLFDGVTPGMYYARVAGVTAQGLEGLVNSVSFSRSLAILRATATLSEGTNEVQFSWERIPGAVYRLEVGDDPCFVHTVVQAAGIGGDTVRVRGLSPGRYWWRVTADLVSDGQRSEVHGEAAPLTVPGIR